MSIASLVASSFANVSDISDCDMYQSAGEQYFILDPSLCSCSPDPPTGGVTEVFTIGGNFVKSVFVDHIAYSVVVYGSTVYTGDQAVGTTEYGTWTTDIGIPIPSGINVPLEFIFTACRNSSCSRRLFVVVTEFIPAAMQ